MLHNLIKSLGTKGSEGSVYVWVAALSKKTDG